MYVTLLLTGYKDNNPLPSLIGMDKIKYESGVNKIMHFVFLSIDSFLYAYFHRFVGFVVFYCLSCFVTLIFVATVFFCYN